MCPRYKGGGEVRPKNQKGKMAEAEMRVTRGPRPCGDLHCRSSRTGPGAAATGAAGKGQVPGAHRPCPPPPPPRLGLRVRVCGCLGRAGRVHSATLPAGSTFSRPGPGPGSRRERPCADAARRPGPSACWPQRCLCKRNTRERRVNQRPQELGRGRAGPYLMAAGLCCGSGGGPFGLSPRPPLLCGWSGGARAWAGARARGRSDRSAGPRTGAAVFVKGRSGKGKPESESDPRPGGVQPGKQKLLKSWKWGAPGRAEEPL